MGRWEPDARGRLAKAAMELYAEHGFEQTTVAEIAARAGLTERTFFRHFTDKREVLFYGMERLRDLLARAVADAPAAATPMDLVGAAFEAAAAMLQENPERVRLRDAIVSANAVSPSRARAWPPRRGSPSSRSPSRAGSVRQASRTCQASSASRWRNCGAYWRRAANSSRPSRGRQRRRRDDGQPHREGRVVREHVLTWLLQVIAAGDVAAEGLAAERVVIPVAVADPAEPAVFGLVRVQVAEHVSQPLRLGQGAVEVVLERGEERVAGPVVRLEDVQVAEHDRGHLRDGGGERGVAGRQP